jgi:hypothetical protein
MMPAILIKLSVGLKLSADFLDTAAWICALDLFVLDS